MRIYSILLLALAVRSADAQTLHPGFDAREYIRLLEITDRQRDTPWTSPRLLPAPEGCRLVYRSPQVGLFNRWDLWLEGDSVGIISIRGSIGRQESWLENFYAAMVPATGTLRLNDSTRFPYRLAADTQACVHVGWLIGVASLAPSVVDKIREYRRKGIRQYIIMGHSQGGSMAFLLRSYLYYLDKSAFGGDIVVKTYCSAASKPGNVFYAYDYDYITRGGWAFRIANIRDWVPETPFSIQTVRDMSPANPFSSASFFSKVYLGEHYGTMDSASTRASAVYGDALGHSIFLKVHETLPELQEPLYAPTSSYSPAGVPIVLEPYPGYDKAFQGSSVLVFMHHSPIAYYQLVLHEYPPAE